MSEQENTAAVVEAPVVTEAVEKKPKPVYTWGVGRRKSAVARVRIATGSGKVMVNGRELNDYFTAERDRKAIFGPLEVTNTGGKLDVLVNADGGGQAGQAGAIVMPISPAFYHKPQSIEEMAGQFADKVLSLLGHQATLTWKPEALE